jgi:hypothetical protein
LDNALSTSSFSAANPAHVILSVLAGCGQSYQNEWPLSHNACWHDYINKCLENADILRAVQEAVKTNRFSTIRSLREWISLLPYLWEQLTDVPTQACFHATGEEAATRPSLGLISPDPDSITNTEIFRLMVTAFTQYLTSGADAFPQWPIPQFTDQRVSDGLKSLQIPCLNPGNPTPIPSLLLHGLGESKSMQERAGRISNSGCPQT